MPVDTTAAPTPADTMAAPAGGIVGLELLAVDQPGSAAIPISDGMVIPAGSYSVVAVTSGSLGSVQFGLNANAAFRTEGVAPYALCGDFRGVFFGCGELLPGANTITATAFPLGGAGGAPINSISVSLTIEN